MGQPGESGLQARTAARAACEAHRAKPVENSSVRFLSMICFKFIMSMVIASPACSVSMRPGRRVLQNAFVPVEWCRRKGGFDHEDDQRTGNFPGAVRRRQTSLQPTKRYFQMGVRARLQRRTDSNVGHASV